MARSEIHTNMMRKYVENRNGVALEIGPLFSPIYNKEEYDVYYTDYCDTNTLREKNKANPGINNVDEIVNIDFVWKPGEQLYQCAEDIIKRKGKFEYVFASHVIEHVPNTIGWLEEVFTVL